MIYRLKFNHISSAITGPVWLMLADHPMNYGFVSYFTGLNENLHFILRDKKVKGMANCSGNSQRAHSVDLSCPIHYFYSFFT